MATPEYGLGAWDYVTLAGLFVLSAAIGVFFAIRGGKENSSQTYFLGNRQMSVLPVSVSIIVSSVSAVTYIGTPAEVYRYGPMYWLMSVNKIVVAGLVTTCFLPVFYNLEISSVYEYIDKRFNKVVRYAVVFGECSSMLIYMGIVMYTPALALSTVTGLSLTGSILAIGLICTFYTAIGGIRAVIWTDVFQAVIMLSGLLVIAIAVCVDIGGASVVWRRAEAGGRTDLVDFNIDPTLRYSFWTVMLGGTVSFLSSAGTLQSYIQRYNSCKSEFQAKLAAWVGIIGVGAVLVIAVFTGLTVHAYYYGCDPLTTRRVHRSDQLIPLLIVDLFHTVPGLPGLLIAGAFSASLSSLSSMVNALAAITGQDIVKSIWKDLPEARYIFVVKLLSAFYGLSAIGVAFLASKLGDIVQAVQSITGIFRAPIFGVFTLGLFCPRANSRGAFIGLLLGIAVGITLKVGADNFPPSHSALPLLVSECDVTTSVVAQVSHNRTFVYNDVTTLPTLPKVHPHPVTKIFSVSFLHYNTIDWLVTLLVGLLVSYLTGATDPSTLDPKLLSPVVLNVFNCCLPSRGGLLFKERGVDDVKINPTDNLAITSEAISDRL